MSSSKKTAISIIIGLLFILLFFVFYGFKGGKPQPKPVYAPEGQLIAGFPKELILDEEVAIKKSYSISYDAAVKQYSASFASAKTMEGLFSDYKQYLEKNNWDITNENKNYSNSRGIYAVNNVADASVAIFDKEGKISVLISYVEVPASTEAGRTVALSLPPPQITRYFGFKTVKPFNLEERIFPDKREYFSSWRTGHLNENYKIIKKGLVSEYGFALENDFSDADTKDFSMTFAKGGESIRVDGISSGDNIGMVTVSLTKIKS